MECNTTSPAMMKGGLLHSGEGKQHTPAAAAAAGATSHSLGEPMSYRYSVGNLARRSISSPDLSSSASFPSSVSRIFGSS
jgi:hypothetical protein